MDFIVFFMASVVLLVFLRNRDQQRLSTLKTLLKQCGSKSFVFPEGNWTRLKPELSDLHERIQESERKSITVLEKSSDVICILDVTGKILKVSPACLQQWGYSPDEIRGMKLENLLSDASLASNLAEVLGAGASLNDISFEAALKRKSGESIEVSWSAYWSVQEQGLFCVAHDISERKKNEEILKASEERLKMVLQTLPVAIVMFDSAGTIELTNKSMCKLCSYDEAEICGSMIYSLLPALCKSNDSFDLEAVKKSCLDRVVDTMVKKKDGAESFAEASMTSLLLFDEPKYVIALLDVSERYEIEQAKRRLTALVSHELRAPISSMHGIFSLLKSGAYGTLNERGTHLVENGVKSAINLIKLVNDLLDMEKMRHGKFVLEMQEISTSELIKTAVGAIEGVAAERKIAIQTKCDGSVCNVDSARLTQVLINLLSNSLKYSPDASTIELGAEKTNEGILFWVADQGRGVPAEKQSQIFEFYAQVKQSDSQIGSGLGLPICKAIVEQHGGKIGLESVVDKGSRFWFLLPAACYLRAGS